MFARVKKLFKRKPEHDRQLYVLTNGFAFVKCKRCGSESIPWEVDKNKAIEYNKDHPDQYTELTFIDKNKDPAGCRVSWFG